MLKKQLEQDFIAAYKAKDSVTKDTLGVAKTRITEWEKENAGKEITDEDVIKILRKEVNKRIDTITIINDPESPLSQSETAQKIVLEKYLPALPAQLTREQLSEKVDAIIASASVEKKQLMGAIMKEMAANFKGQFDGKLLQEVVKEKLN